LGGIRRHRGGAPYMTETGKMTIDQIVEPLPQRLGERGFLAGTAALVTGGARRIGRSLCLALAREGATVVVHYWKSESDAEATVLELEAFGGSAFKVKGDLSQPSVPAEMIAQAAEAAGRPLDILINNASVFAQGSPVSTTVDQWDLNQAVNLRAPFLLSQAFAGQVPPGITGNIINLNDFRVTKPGSDHFAYTISKVGLHGLTRSLALALAPGIRVNELALGAVLAPEEAPTDYEHTLREQIPSRKFPSLDEVSNAMVFLLGNDGVTGQTIFVDGGRHLT
jgi:NAD(P)-dependent dehydrogenase (short-subunit alcohol dehydrogenase family)